MEVKKINGEDVVRVSYPSNLGLDGKYPVNTEGRWIGVNELEEMPKD